MQKIFMGNWKMNKTPSETISYLEEFLPLVNRSAHRIGLFVPFTSLYVAADYSRDSNVLIGAQDLSEHSIGAYTGEVSATMVKDAGADIVLLGHSERRHYFAESNALINRKIKSALKENLQVVLCVGETLDERKEERTEEILQEELEQCLLDLSAADLTKITIAYEPIWAIGTGLALEPSGVESAHTFCKNFLKANFEIQNAPILYGGSVNAQNIHSLLEIPAVDGVLVGGYSLNAQDFAKILVD